jgi:hypothetical protein
MKTLLLIVVCATAATVSQARADPSGAEAQFKVGQVLASDDFRDSNAQWTSELEKGGKVEIHEGSMEIDVPAGCTVWFKPKLQGPILIEYDATVISAGGPNDRVSDLNCFWMATDARSPSQGIFDVPRSGKFADYNPLRCYYVGLGGNTNTTTRFRRYIGSKDDRPLLPEHDLSDKQFMLQPNVRQTIQLVACENLIQYWRDGRKIFELNDAHPYTSGWFAIRTTKNHMTVQHFRVLRLLPAATTTAPATAPATARAAAIRSGPEYYGTRQSPRNRADGIVSIQTDPEQLLLQVRAGNYRFAVQARQDSQ